MEDIRKSDATKYDPLSGLSGLAHIIDAVREQERRELARELHDTVMQPLASLAVSLAFSVHQHDAGSSLETFIDTWKQQVQEALDALRSTLLGLSWQLSANAGLVESLQSRLVPQLKQQGITLTIEERVWPNSLPLEWTSQLYLIVREALTNVEKHALASEARVILDSSSGYLSVVVQDDGAGFSRVDQVTQPRRSAGTGLGITGMHARVRALDGRLKIAAAPGAGTRVEITLPNPTASQRSRATSAIDQGLPATDGHSLRIAGA